MFLNILVDPYIYIFSLEIASARMLLLSLM